jgi:hypothetical protein
MVLFVTAAGGRVVAHTSRVKAAGRAKRSEEERRWRESRRVATRLKREEGTCNGVGLGDAEGGRRSWGPWRESALAAQCRCVKEILKKETGYSEEVV